MRRWAESRGMAGGQPVVQEQMPAPQPRPRRGRGWGWRGGFYGPGGREGGWETKETQVEIPALQEEKLEKLRWKRIAIVFVTIGIIALVSMIVTLPDIKIWPGYLVIGCSVVIGLVGVIRDTINSDALSPYLLDYIARQREDNYTDWYYAPGVGGGLVLVVIGAIWEDWRAWVILGAAWVIWGIWYVWLDPISLTLYRYASEIVDPHGPTSPRYPEGRGGPRMPGDPEPVQNGKVDEGHFDEIKELLKGVLKKLDSPGESIWTVPVNNNATKSLPKERKPRPGERTFKTVSGRKAVPAHLMVAFARRAGDMGTGLQAWKRVGWNEPLWSDVIDLWERWGCFKRGKPGESGRFLISFEEAMQRLQGGGGQ